MTPDLLAAGLAMTRNGRVIERGRHPVIYKGHPATRNGQPVTAPYENRASYMGTYAGGLIAWCPFCDHPGTRVPKGPDFGARLDRAITGHLETCSGFAATAAKLAA